jgi:DNA-binding NarL/FixJ family response regulator
MRGQNNPFTVKFFPGTVDKAHNEQTMPTLAIYSDREILAAGLRQVIPANYRVEVLRLKYLETPANSPDAVILDTASGADRPMQRFRSADRKTPVIIWDRAEALESALNAMALGAQGVLLDSSSPADVLACFDTVLDGGTWMPPEVAQAATLTRQCKLTRREAELVNLIALGRSNKDIAFSLGISVGTVKVYLCRLFDKVGVADRYGLALVALRQAGSGAASAKSKATPDQYFQRSVFVPIRTDEWKDQPTASCSYRHP